MRLIPQCSAFTQLISHDHQSDDDEPALSKRKLISLWSMLVKNMELHKYQIQQVLHQQRAQLAQQGTEVPDEHIGTYSWRRDLRGEEKTRGACQIMLHDAFKFRDSIV